MKEFIRLRCPCCGSMPYTNQVDELDKKYPPEVRIIAMKVGGKVPAEKVEGEEYHKIGRGKAKGKIIYKDVTDQHPGLVANYKAYFLKRANELK